MPTYVVRWSNAGPYGKATDYEYDEFFVEEDPDPRAAWIIRYKSFYKGQPAFDYWTKTKPNTLRSWVLNRNLECSAVDVHVERLDFHHTGETRLVQLSRLALQLERSRAMLFGRPVRRFEGMGVRIRTERSVVPSVVEEVIPDPIEEPVLYQRAVEIVPVKEYFTSEVEETSSNIAPVVILSAVALVSILFVLMILVG